MFTCSRDMHGSFTYSRVVLCVLWRYVRTLGICTYPKDIYVLWKSCSTIHTLGIFTYCGVMHGFFTYFGEMYGFYTYSGVVLNVLSTYLRNLEIRTFLIRTLVILYVLWELRPKVQ